MNVESSFAKILGRTPTEQERERLYRIRDAFGLSENDAFWFIVMTLEHYDALYRDYPRQIADEAGRTIEQARQAFARAAEQESAKAQQLLSERVAETSVAIAKKLAERPIGIHRVTAMLAVVVLFGALCLTTGYKLATTDKPFWATRAVDGRAAAIGIVLSAPAGWMVFILLLPAAAYAGRNGWKTAKDFGASPREQAWGWGLVVLAVVGSAACIVIIFKVT